MDNLYNRMNQSTFPLTALAVFLCLIVFTYEAQAVVFGDGDFIPAQWQSQTFLTQTSTAAASTLSLVGNPPDARSLVLYSSTGFLQPVGRSMIVELKTSAVVSPASVGGITQVDYTEDHYCECFGGGVLWGPAVEQGGVYYIVPGHAMPNGISNVWMTESLTGLTAADFDQVDVNSSVWSNPNSHPDFSSGGLPVTFGYVRAKAFVAHTESVLDNWSVTVTEGVVANENQSWGTLKSAYR